MEFLTRGNLTLSENVHQRVSTTPSSSTSVAEMDIVTGVNVHVYVNWENVMKGARLGQISIRL